MIIFKTAETLQAYTGSRAFDLRTIGFVPTMGALHSGHISLIEQCKQDQQLTIVSIFINPTQFNDQADFQKYPVTIENDIRLLEAVDCDILFLPSIAEIYPDGFSQPVHYELGELEHILEGYYRPGHFQGVCQVVYRLLEIVKPGHLYLGRKDYQQCMVIKKMLELTALQVDIHLVPTVREPDGLAMSSRNTRLSADQRQKAGSIYCQMTIIKNNLLLEPVTDLAKTAVANLLNEGFSKVDYVSIVNPYTLLPLEEITGGVEAMVLVAAFLDNVRLIDNIKLT